MNPKAMPRQRLLGHIDMDTREWFDGVLTYSARQVVKTTLEEQSWIICDGDIDPEWIESLNSVLDDNRLLTMPSGERIQFGPNVNFLFETNDLRHVNLFHHAICSLTGRQLCFTCHHITNGYDFSI